MNLINIAQAGVISDAPKLSEIGLKAFEFLLTIAGIIAVIGIVISGTIYLAAGGNEKILEKAKKSFNYSIIGVVIIIAALIIVKTVSYLIS